MKSQTRAVATCALGTLTVNLNTTALGLALPRIRDDLRPDDLTLRWVAAAFVLTLAAGTLLGGALGDRLRKRGLLSVSLILYIIGCILGAVAPTGALLVVARIVSGAGACVLVPVGLATIRLLSRTPAELVRSVSLWGTMVGLGMALGPILGGFCTAIAGWRSLLVVLAGLGVVFFALLRCFVPDLPGNPGHPIDLTGTLLLGTVLAALTATVLLIDRGEIVAIAGGLFGVAAIALGLWSRRHRDALIPTVMRAARENQGLSAALTIAAVNYLGLGVTLFSLAFLLQDHAGLGPAVAGVATLPLALATAIGAAWAGHTISAMRAIHIAAIMVVCGASGIAAGILMHISASGWILLELGSAALGFSAGAANTPVNALALAGLPRSLAGTAGAALSSGRQLGLTLGIAGAGLMLGQGRAESSDAYLGPGIMLVLIAATLALLAGSLRQIGEPD